MDLIVKYGNDMFRKRDKLRMIKDTIKDKNLQVEINGQKCKIIGKIAMNSCIADITDKNVNLGDEVKIEVNPIFVDSSIKRNYN